jgi:hypothetical protein
VVRVVGVGDGIKRLVEAGDAAAILGRRVALAGDVATSSAAASTSLNQSRKRGGISGARRGQRCSVRYKTEPEAIAELFKDLALWAVERLDAGDQAPFGEDPNAFVEAVFALHLITIGCNRASVAARASSYARLWIWQIIEALQERHKGLQPSWRVKEIVAAARKLHSLKKPAVIRGHAEKLASEIRRTAPELARWLGHVGSASAERAVERLDRIHASRKGDILTAEIEALVDGLGQLASEYETRISMVANEMATLKVAHRPKKNRIFGYRVELLAQGYAAKSGKTPRDEVHQIEGRPRGEFFKLVEIATKKSKLRPQGQEGLKKAITRVLDRSPRVPRKPAG